MQHSHFDTAQMSHDVTTTNTILYCTHHHYHKVNIKKYVSYRFVLYPVSYIEVFPFWIAPTHQPPREIRKQKAQCQSYLRARGGSTAASRRLFSERGVQLSTTDNFCRKNGKCCTIKYCISFLRILDVSDVVLNSTTFSIFLAKIPVVLNCTYRQKRAYCTVQYAKLPWNHLERRYATVLYGTQIKMV